MLVMSERRGAPLESGQGVKFETSKRQDCGRWKRRINMVAK